MRRIVEQLRALGEGFAHEPELEMLEITQPAMDQLGGCRGCRAGIIALLREQDFEPAPRSVARDGRAVDPSANDEKVERRRHQTQATPARRRSWMWMIPTGRLASTTNSAVMDEALISSSAALASRSGCTVLGPGVIMSPVRRASRPSPIWRRRSPSVMMPVSRPPESTTPRQPNAFS